MMQAVGEPPLFLSASVLFAIKDAIRVARKERGYSVVFDLQTPATAERIRLACEDQFTVMVRRYFSLYVTIIIVIIFRLSKK